MAKVTIAGRTYDVEVRGETVVVDGHEFPVSVREEKGFTLVNAGGVGYRVQLPHAADRASGMLVDVDYRHYAVEYEGRLGGGPAPHAPRPSAGATTASAGAANVAGAVVAQIAGRIITVKVKVGDTVARGDILLLLEAMKMENEVKAKAACVVAEVHVAEGATVEANGKLFTLA